MTRLALTLAVLSLPLPALAAPAKTPAGPRAPGATAPAPKVPGMVSAADPRAAAAGVEMLKAGGGSIVNISSVAGLVGNPYSSAYNASKGAVRLLTKSTAIQYAKDGIRANSIHPGVIVTPMTQDVVNDPSFREFRLAANPISRLGQPADIAYGALYLASDESSFVTGSELVIDGGWTAQ